MKTFWQIASWLYVIWGTVEMGLHHYDQAAAVIAFAIFCRLVATEVRHKE